MIDSFRVLLLSITIQLLSTVAYSQSLVSKTDSLTIEEKLELLRIYEIERTFSKDMIKSQRQTLKDYKANQYLMISILFVLGLVTLFLVYQVLKTKRAKEMVFRQHEVLQQHQRHINHTQKELRKALKIARDTSRRLIRSNRQLKSMQSHLVQAEKMSSLGQLTAGIVHEINNPVNFVKGGIELIERNLMEVSDIMFKIQGQDEAPTNDLELKSLYNELNEELKHLNEFIPQTLKDMLFGTNRITEIINGLRIFSRQEDSSPEQTDIHQVIDSALLIMKNKYDDKAELIIDYDQDINEIECYPGLLNQVIVSLISNAVDAIDKNGTIQIETKNQKDDIVLTVRDNGKGIAPEHLKHIFEPFFTTKEVGQGTGIGLSITYSIIKKHKAEISVDSKQGEGTTFKIKLRKNLELVDKMKETILQNVAS